MILLMLTALARGPILDAAQFASEKTPSAITDRALGAVIAWNVNIGKAQVRTQLKRIHWVVEEGQSFDDSGWLVYRRYGLIHSWEMQDGKFTNEQVSFSPLMPMSREK